VSESKDKLPEEDLLKRLQVKERLGGGFNNSQAILPENTNPSGNNEPEPSNENSFIQLQSRQTSNENIPKYLDSTISGKGWSLNQAPLKRKVKNINKLLFHDNYSAGMPKDSRSWMEYLLAMFSSSKDEEDGALGGNEEKPLLDSDKKDITEIKLPDWFCPVVCAGLSLEDLFENLEDEDNENNQVKIHKPKVESHLDPL